MKRCFALTLVALCALATFAHAQKRRTPLKAAQARSYCQGDKLPAGYVIVGMRQSQRCGSLPELEIKKPTAASEVMCDGSPIPDGYSMTGTTGSFACRGASPNPLTNALVIKRDGAPAENSRPAGCPIKIGVNANIVRACLGEPGDIQVTVEEEGRQEVWRYFVYDRVVLRLILEDDRLTQIRYAK